MSRQTVLGLSGWCVAGVVLLCGAGHSGDLRAKKLEIEDEKGNVVILMAGGPAGPSVYVVDPKSHKVRISLLIHPELSIPSISLYDAKGEESWDVSAWSDGPVVTRTLTGRPRRN